MKVLYLTNQIPNYRKNLYESLGECVNLTIAHFGKLNSSNHYQEIPLEIYKSKLFIYIKNKIDYDSYDVVLIWGNLRLWEVFKLSFKRNKKFKLILFGPGVSSSYTKKYDNDWKVSFIYKWLLKKADAAIFYDNYPVIKYAGKNILPDKLFCAPNTVDIKSTPDLKTAEKDSFLFFGTLYKQKGTEILLEAYKKLKLKNKENLPKLNIVGDGPEKEELSKWVENNNLKKEIIFHGRITDRETIESFFKKAFACISPKQAGLSVIESMAYGVPFVTTKYPITGGEYNAIIEGANGFFYDGSINGLTDTLYDILNIENFDYYSDNCLEYYKRFRSPQLWLKQMLRALNYTQQ